MPWHVDRAEALVTDGSEHTHWSLQRRRTYNIAPLNNVHANQPCAQPLATWPRPWLDQADVPRRAPRTPADREQLSIPKQSFVDTNVLVYAHNFSNIHEINETPDGQR